MHTNSSSLNLFAYSSAFVIIIEPLTGTLSPLFCLKHFSSSSSTSLRSYFRNRLILYPFCSTALRILVLFYQIFWRVEFTRQNSRHMSAFLFPLYIPRITLTFSTIKNFLLLASVAMLSLYQCPLKCKSGKVRGQLYSPREVLLCSSLSRHGIYIYFVVQLEGPGLKCYCIVEHLFRTCGNTE